MGREQRCRVILSDARVSRLYAAFWVQDGAVSVHDERSNNGTQVGEQALLPGAARRVRLDDRVHIGSTMIQAALASPAGAAAARWKPARWSAAIVVSPHARGKGAGQPVGAGVCSLCAELSLTSPDERYNRMFMKTEFEYIVLGLGGIGAGTAYWLARRAGGAVLGLEQFELGHVRGESQDHSRIIRLSYHTPGYVALAKQAYSAWAALEADAGEQLILKTGGLDLAPQPTAIALGPYRASMAAEGVAFESLDAAEVMRRWPQFRLTDDVQGLYQAESGIALAAKCNAAHLRLARQYGAVLREHAPVTALRAAGDEVEVVAGGTAYRGRRLIIAAGPWSNAALAHFGLRLPLTVTQEQVTYFASPRVEAFHPARFPIWIWLDDPCFYGFPVYGEAGPKVAQDVGGEEVTADTRTFEPNAATLARTISFLEQRLPAMVGPIIYTKTCLYTLPPDRDFVLDALPGHPNVFLAIGAGHAFKFASLLGRTLAEMAMQGTTPADIAPFRYDRALLRMENPPKNFMT